ncbi:hypothetical protein HDV64DRAFT_119756 [Trichoderma sp. TUCIM 5745]
MILAHFTCSRPSSKASRICMQLPASSPSSKPKPVRQPTHTRNRTKKVTGAVFSHQFDGSLQMEQGPDSRRTKIIIINIGKKSSAPHKASAESDLSNGLLHFIAGNHAAPLSFRFLHARTAYHRYLLNRSTVCFSKPPRADEGNHVRISIFAFFILLFLGMHVSRGGIRPGVRVLSVSSSVPLLCSVLFCLSCKKGTIIYRLCPLTSAYMAASITLFQYNHLWINCTYMSTYMETTWVYEQPATLYIS